MRYYEVTGGQDANYYNGEFPQPYPDLCALFLEPNTPQNVHVIIREGHRPGDMIFSSPNVVSERVLRVLEDCHATGYQPFPVAVSIGASTLNYWGLKLLGRGGPFDPQRSEAVYGPDGRALCGYKYIYMHEMAWDGSDVFAIPGLGIGMYVTQRVKEALDGAKLLNVRITVNTDCYLCGPRLRAEWERLRREG